eukprot:CAMPEP_0178751446 /NCGR_PEP_ID=MMETSP0744-20121128/10533_1 /TAXON_ID=913974 /ORGANISM="Nitzschia punctata, Strain CCMP561" /LENGTH=130 /DNA_ID=CAMNT_0020405097 /DNA_START=408 /DNA_END=801 /DNA_ORIENTATION=-
MAVALTAVTANESPNNDERQLQAFDFFDPDTDLCDNSANPLEDRPNWDPVTLLASHDATGIKISVTIANLAGIISIATITNTNFTFNTIVSFVIPKAGVDVLLAVPGGTVNPKRDVSSKKRDIPVPSGFR